MMDSTDSTENRPLKLAKREAEWTLGVDGRAAEGGRSNSDVWPRIRRRIGTSSWLMSKTEFCESSAGG